MGLSEYGGPEVLDLIEVDVPEPGVRQVRISVRATPVTPADVWLRQGGVDRLMVGAPRPFVPGLELAGIVESAGPGTSLSPGDVVVAVTTFIGTGRGCQAQLVVVDEHDVALCPPTLATAAASTVPMSGLTAELCLDTLDVEPGGRVAVTGANGVVGGFVIELGEDRGLEMVRVERGDATPDGEVDGLVDCAGVGEEHVPAVRSGGRVVVLRPPPDELVAACEAARVTHHLVSVRSRQGDPDRLAALMDRAARGVLTPRVVATAPASDVVDLHSRFDRGGLDGRLVITWDDETR